VTKVVAFDGTRFEIDAENGSSLMEVVVRNYLLGIVAECGGASACATRHVYLDQTFASTISPPKAMEVDMLDFAYDVQSNSRLSCQLRITDDMEDLIVHLPERQG